MRRGLTPPIWRTALLALLLIAGAQPEARAQDNLEDAVKATFLYRFGSFADWPADAFADTAAPFVVCVAGSDAFAALVEQSAGSERVAGRPIIVRRLGVVTPASGCHILYLAFSSRQAIVDALQATTGDAVLTITDARHGDVRGAIHFVLSGGRVRFHIDRRAAERNHVALSSRLLNIALSVRGASG